MNISPVRGACLIGCVGTAKLSLLLFAFLQASGGVWESGNQLGIKAGLLAILGLFIYFAVSAALDRFLWISLLRSKLFLAGLGIVAILFSISCLVLSFSGLAQMKFGWLSLASIVISALVSAICFRFAFEWQAFGILTLIYGVPLALLSIGPINFVLFPPPADPVGGNGIGIGIVLAFMLPFAGVSMANWFASMFFENWRRRWRVIMALLCLPGSTILAAALLGFF